MPKRKKEKTIKSLNNKESDNKKNNPNNQGSNNNVKKKIKKIEDQLISKKNKKNIIKIIIISSIILILFIIITFIFGLQIQFVLQEQMTLSVTPIVISETILTGSKTDVSFTININKPKVCKSECTLELYDLSQNKLVKSEKIFDIYHYNFNTTLNVPSKGEGQIIFNFKATCNNKKSNICNTNEKKYFKTSLITINYNLNKNETEIKNKLKKELESYYYELHQIDTIYHKINYFLNNINYSITNKFKDKISNLELNLNEDYINLWNNKEYLKLEKQFNPNISIKDDINILKINLNNTINTYNQELLKIKNISESKIINELYSMKLRENLSIEKINQIKLEIENIKNNFNNYNSFEEFFEKSKEIYHLFTELNKSRNILKEEINKKGIKQINKIQDILKINQTNSSINICKELNQLTKQIDSNNNRSLQIMDLKYPEINKTILIKESKKYFYNKLNKIPFNSSLNISNWDELMIINESEIINPYYNKHCISNEFNLIILFEYEKFIINFKLENYTSNIIFKISENNPICCVYNICKDCLDQPNKNYPIIFIHGHAISKENRPELSHEAFGKIQNLMEDEGFINAGQMGEQGIPEISKGEWGQFDSPITIRASYYFLTYYDIGTYQVITQKSDKLENYAIRLKEAINIIKSKTGKNKVTIIAHSMGGLVAREYERLFGPEDLHLIITIGTPNKGIEGRIKKLCSITGASRECRDMNHDSIFLRKLNAHVPKVPIYTIRANGCKMSENKTGDGIVLAENVPLAYATNYEIIGNCTDFLNSNLHTRFLDPEIYPETYNTMLKIIKKYY